MYVELDGEKIFMWRYRNFTTQEPMAEMAGISSKTLARAENGHRAVALETARKLAGVMGMEPKALERS